jgi:hypothetical protein
MPTRFYLPSTGAADILPAWSVSWYDATSFSAAKLKAVTARISSVMTTKTMTDLDVTDRHFACGMWVSDRLAPQTIAVQALSCSIKCSETSNSNNLLLHWIVRLIAADGITFRTIISFRQDGTEVPLTASIASRYDTLNTTLATAVGGDRIVIEVGLGGDPSTTFTHNGSMIIGDDSATDLNAADADTGIRNPWVEFANTLTFMRDRVFVTHQ